MAEGKKRRRGNARAERVARRRSGLAAVNAPAFFTRKT